MGSELRFDEVIIGKKPKKSVLRRGPMQKYVETASKSKNSNFTHPIFESDFDCLTGKYRTLAISLLPLLPLKIQISNTPYQGWKNTEPSNTRIFIDTYILKIIEHELLFFENYRTQNTVSKIHITRTSSIFRCSKTYLVRVESSLSVKWGKLC